MRCRQIVVASLASAIWIGQASAESPRLPPDGRWSVDATVGLGLELANVCEAGFTSAMRGEMVGVDRSLTFPAEAHTAYEAAEAQWETSGGEVEPETLLRMCRLSLQVPDVTVDQGVLTLRLSGRVGQFSLSTDDDGCWSLQIPGGDGTSFGQVCGEDAKLRLTLGHALLGLPPGTPACQHG